MSRWLLAALLVCLLLAPLAAQAALVAGAARVDITPDLATIGKVCLGGYGAREAKPAEGVLDHVYARALVLGDGKQKVCFLSLDLTQPPGKLHGELLAKIAPLGIGTLVVGASHSHSAPDNHSDVPPMIAMVFGAKNPKLAELISAGALKAIQDANAALQPARAGAGVREMFDLNSNRRGEEGGLLIDPALTVLRVESTAGKPIAALFNWTAHPTIMSDDNMKISGEWPGIAETTIEAGLPGAVALYFNGAEGDQSPRAERFGEKYAASTGYGKEIATRVLALWKTVKPSPTARLAAATADLAMPTPKVSPAFMTSIAVEYKITEEAANALVLGLGIKSVPQMAVAVGDACFITIPGEMVSQPLGLALKQKARQAGFAQPVLLGLAPWDVSYILDEVGYNVGGYEASMSFFGPKLGEMICTGAAELLGKVKPVR